MKAVVLAGGFGTRLKAVVRDLPKAMAPVGSGYFLDCLLECLISSGIKEYIFCLHYLPDKIIEYLGDGERFGISVNYSIETTPLGTAGAVGLLRHILRETFCVVNADTYIEADLRECLKWHRAQKALTTLCAVKVEDSGRFGALEFDSQRRIVGFREKPGTGRDRWINGGIYLMEPGIFQYIPEKHFCSMERDVFPLLLKSNEKIYGYPLQTYFFDIGVPEDYKAFQAFIAGKGKKGDI